MKWNNNIPKLPQNTVLQLKLETIAILIKFIVISKIANSKLITITEIQRNSKVGYYFVLKGICLDQQFECPNSIANVSQTKNAKYIAKQILPLFNEHTPSLNYIKSAFNCFNEEKFTTSELKYI